MFLASLQRLGLLVLLLLTVPASASATIHIQTLTTTGYALSPAIAIGGDGAPVVAYYDGATRDLVLVRCQTPLCTGPSAVTLDAAGDVGAYASLELTQDDRPVLAYYDATNGDLKLAVCGDPACKEVAIRVLAEADDVGRFAALALDGDDIPRVSYIDASAGHLLLARCFDPGCLDVAHHTLDDGDLVGPFDSIALTSDGRPVVSYLDLYNGALKLAICADIDCEDVSLKMIDVGAGGGLYTSVALGTDDIPVVSYYSVEEADLRLARCQDPSCGGVATATLDSVGDVGRFTSLALTSDGYAVASYDYDNGRVKLKRCFDVLCSATTERVVDGGDGDFGPGTTMATALDGSMYLVYADASTGNLRMAHLSLPSGDVAPLVPDGGAAAVDAAVFSFSAAMMNFDPSDVVLSRDGQNLPLGEAGLSADIAARVFVLSGLAPLTGVPGHYRLELSAGGSDVQDLSGDALTGNVSADWVVPATIVDSLALGPLAGQAVGGASKPSRGVRVALDEPSGGPPREAHHIALREEDTGGGAEGWDSNPRAGWSRPTIFKTMAPGVSIRFAKRISSSLE